MKNSLLFYPVYCAVLFVLLSCASKREIIQFTPPRPPIAAKNGVQVFIRSVVDTRQFNDKAGAPDAPSLRSPASDAAVLQSRTVGRKRSMYNDPEGELLLGENKTVVDVVLQITADALMSAGYEVAQELFEARDDAVMMDVAIEEYWAWSDSEAFSTILQSRIVAAISILSEAGTPIRVQAEASRKTRVPGNYDWQETFRAVHEQYAENLREILNRSPLVSPVPDFSQEAGDLKEETDTDTPPPSTDSPQETIEPPSKGEPATPESAIESVETL